MVVLHVRSVVALNSCILSVANGNWNILWSYVHLRADLLAWGITCRYLPHDRSESLWLKYKIIFGVAQTHASSVLLVSLEISCSPNIHFDLLASSNVGFIKLSKPDLRNKKLYPWFFMDLMSVEPSVFGNTSYCCKVGNYIILFIEVQSITNVLFLCKQVLSECCNIHLCFQFKLDRFWFAKKICSCM